MSNTDTKKKLKRLIGVLIIGIAGSGLWDSIVKPTFFNIGKLFANIATQFNKNYPDHLYSSVGYENHMLEVFPGLMLFAVIVIFFPFSVYVRLLLGKKDKIEVLKKDTDGSPANSVQGKVLQIILGISVTILSIFYFDIFISSQSSRNAASTINRNLEIIRPYINENSFFLLRSKFRQIDNKAKLVDELTAIRKIATDNKIVIEDADLYGIEVK